MALKPHRKYNDGTNIQFFMNEVAERGVIVVYDTSLTGDYTLDNVSNAVKLPTSGYTGEAPAGLLLVDVKDYDPSTCYPNYHKREVPITGKVEILRHGVVTTNMVDDVTIVPGEDAYFVEDGLLTNVVAGTKVGTFMSPIADDGYVQVDITIGS